MILYILKSMGCLTLLLFFYHLILEKEKMHNFNRFYLLGSILFSFLIPLATITIDKVVDEPIILNDTLENQAILENTTPIIAEVVFDYNLLFIGIYILVSFIFLIRFGRNLFKIIKKIKRNELINYKNAVLVLVDDKILPHTFWKYIFINKNDYYTHKIEEELFTHELTHVTQKHTLDVLLIEFFQAIFWVNPLFIFLKKSIQLNHEFLADESVINQYKNTFHYQYLLLNKAAWNNEYYLASNLNYSLTKKRLEMMTIQSSPTKILLKKLAIIPLLIGFIFLFAERVEAQEYIETITEQPENVQKTKFKKKENSNKNSLEVIEEQKLSTQEDEINTGFKILKGNRYYFVTVGNKTKYYNKDGKLANSSGKILSHKKARASNIIPDNYVTKTYFGGKVFCEFTDDIPIRNQKGDKEIREVINKISTTYNIAKYQKLNRVYEQLRSQKPHYIKSSKSRKKEINKQFSLLGTLYFKLSKNDKEKVRRPILPHDPYLKLRKNNKVFYKLRNELTEEDKLLIPPPPPPPNATKEEILKAKKAYKEWKNRTGNEIPPPPPPRNHLDQVIEMAKKGAKFYYEGKPINSDKAIALLKKNKKLNIHSESTNYSNYKVWISKTPIKN